MKLLIKYCGCQSEEDYRLLSKTRADMIGFVFAESKRKVKPSEVAAWVKNNGKQKGLVGVFQDAPIEEIIKTVKEVPLDVIQCHGNEPVQTIKDLKIKTKKRVFKAIPYDGEIMKKIRQYGNYADGIIVDSVSKGQFGGTGVPFLWKKVPSMMKEAEQQGVLCMIAGGITPVNVSSLLKYKPMGIDISGGIEDNGKKCEGKIVNLERMIVT
jgi:phosphoribosylanthranilate isomerase